MPAVVSEIVIVHVDIRAKVSGMSHCIVGCVVRLITSMVGALAQVQLPV